MKRLFITLACIVAFAAAQAVMPRYQTVIVMMPLSTFTKAQNKTKLKVPVERFLQRGNFPTDMDYLATFSSTNFRTIGTHLPIAVIRLPCVVWNSPQTPQAHYPTDPTVTNAVAKINALSIANVKATNCWDTEDLAVYQAWGIEQLPQGDVP